MDTQHEEVWKPVSIRPQYQVSDLGRFRGPVGLRTAKPKKDGYVRVNLGPRPAITRTLHSLIAEAFLGPRPRGWCVNHKNGIRHDNRLENLEWVSYSLNNRLAKRRKLSMTPRAVRYRLQRDGKLPERRHYNVGSEHGMSTYQAEKVCKVHELRAQGRLHREIASELDMHYQTVSDILAGRSWRHLHPDAQKRL